MFRKFYKKMSVIAALCVGIVGLNVVPAFASTKTVTSPQLSAATASTLVDGQTINETVTGIKTYNIKVTDSDARQIFIGSTAPVKTILMSTSLPNLMNYDSGFYRIGSKISWHFIPGMDYQLLVIPQDSSTPVSLSVSMTKTSTSSWINYGSYSIKEANILMGGQAEIYDVQFPTNGRYKIRFETNLTNVVGCVQSTFGYNNSAIINGSLEYVIDAQATGYQNSYSIIVFNIGQDKNSGGAYTVTVEKVN